MGRSVITVTDAVCIVYLEHGCEEWGVWGDFIDDLRYIICQKYKSFRKVSHWDGREEHRILENELAKVVICEYCGIASINLATRAKCYDHIHRDMGGLTEHWCHQIADGFAKLFSDRLCRLGTMSNGVSVYERVNK